jgi:hypothetical protein
MADFLKRQWEDKLREKLTKQEHFIDASSDRRHGQFVMNRTKSPLAIGGIGRDFVDDDGRRIKNVLFLKVVGEDDMGGGFADIREYSDEQLDKSRNYMDLLEKKWIQELSEEDYKVMLERVQEYRYKMQTDYAFYWQVRMQDLMSRQMFVTPHQYERIQEPIMEVDLDPRKRNKYGLDPENDWKAAGVSASFDTMSQFYRGAGSY